jgi:cysteine desulfurase
MVILGFDFAREDVAYVSKSEHPSLIGPLKKCEEKGLILKDLPLNKKGQIDENIFFKNLDQKTSFIVLSHINNQSGVIQPVESFSRKIKKLNPSIKIHLDATQSFSKIPISLKNSDIDFMTVSSHKLGGPKGIAGLFFRKGIQVCPLLWGGGQEQNLRPSTQSFPLISSFKCATDEAMVKMNQSYEHIKRISQIIIDRLRGEVSQIIFPFDGNVSPYILTFIVPGISSDIILRHMEQEDIIFSSTSACSSKIKGENPVFEAIGIHRQFHKNVLRVSFSHENTVSEIEVFCEKFIKIYKELKFLFSKN